jgi:hypothetical protein
MTNFVPTALPPHFTRAAFPRLVGLTSAPINCATLTQGKRHAVSTTYSHCLMPVWSLWQRADWSHVSQICLSDTRAVGTQKHISNWWPRHNDDSSELCNIYWQSARNVILNTNLPAPLSHHVTRTYTSQKCVKYTSRWNARSYLKVTTDSVQ